MPLLFIAFIALILGFFMKIMRFFVEKNVMKTVEKYNLKTYLLSDFWNLTYPLILGGVISVLSGHLALFFTSFFSTSFGGQGNSALQTAGLSQWIHEHYTMIKALGTAGFFSAGMIITFGTIHKVIRYFGYAMVGLTMFVLCSATLFHVIAFGS